ncbi:hypothetical protein HAHI6034_11070 [Hathewaya histolytica]|uniref:Uncharacterized protein n=1 Tax=Hathewaya histolytica TaxID=1498 RepID=A0A4U9RC14_HATHI|nr:hypothetical protein [Hathewaya histolytica]VTQ88498.1 Uncharacterised protein [Hathewaya histolytica]
MFKVYCMKCKKEVSEDTNRCECGNRSFVYGNNFYLEGEKVICNCGCYAYGF